MTTGIIRNEQELEKQIEKHMAGGCMAGFFNLFDRNHILSSHGHNRRLYAPKRLLPSTNRPSSSPAVDSASESVSSVGSPSSRFKDFDKAPPSPQPLKLAPSPDKPPEKKAPVSPVSSFKGEEPAVAVTNGSKVSPWKFTREAPRLSLDSRAVIDAKGKLHPREIKTNASMSANRRQSSVGCTTEYDDEESERQRSSPSVIARLMGLDPLALPSQSSSTSDCRTPGELRRSASESRSRDLLQCRFENNFSNQSNYTSNFNVVTARDNRSGGFVATDKNPNNNSRTNARLFGNSGGHQNNIARGTSGAAAAAPARQNHTQRTASSRLSPQHSHHYHNNNQHMTRKGFYDSGDFFPDLKQQPAAAPTSGGTIEKRLRMRGIEEASRDLETLKHILDALQLKGLLHHSATTKLSPVEQQNNRAAQSSPVVLMKTGRFQPESDGLRARTALPRRNLSCDTTTAAASPRLARSPGRSPRSPSRSEKVGSPAARRNQTVSVETSTGRRSNGGIATCSIDQQQRRRGGSSPVQSPRMVGNGRRMDQTANRSPRTSPRRRSTGEFVRERGRRGEEDESSTVSESSFSTSTDTERSKMDEYKDGKSILERCDKLLHSIAEMNSATMVSSSNNKNKNSSNGSSSGELQPSPVSVLDPSFYREEEESPSPVKKRTIYFTDQQVVELDEEAWSSPSSTSALPASSLSLLKSSSSSDDLDGTTEDHDNPEVAYISDILRATEYFPEDSNSDLFLLLEKHQSLKLKDTSKSAKLNRRLLFDATIEIIDRNRRMPPWKCCALPEARSAQMNEIWSEIERIRSRDDCLESDDLLEEICGVMKRDMVDNDSIQGWNGSHMEVSEAVLDIERLIFKDLIGETIRDLAADRSEELGAAPRRKLLF